MCATTGVVFIVSVIVFSQLFHEHHVESKICTKVREETRTFIESYWHTYMTYENKFYEYYGYEAVKRRVQKTRSMQKQVTTSYFDCCSGYQKNTHLTVTTPRGYSESNATIECNPICSKTCKNGFCRSPDKCGCNTGYIPDLSDPYNCLPLCSKSCGRGTCIAPEKCQCETGYKFTNQTCLPICSKTCTNGTCVAPETCECMKGYEKSEKYTCRPHCTGGCPNGTCTGPDTCMCNAGWQMVKTNSSINSTCQPICTDPCQNGTCIAPETCQCLPGYKQSEKNICQPHCSSGCLNGFCIAPETCVCNAGWQMVYANSSINNTCQPICTDHCQNGTCIAPETCECLPGYKQSEKNICKPHCSSGCLNGSCISPETCVCNTGWQMVYANNSINNTCQPICSDPCRNGTCIAPETCQCLPGYKQSEKNICLPYCQDGCSNGVCNAGWNKSNLGDVVCTGNSSANYDELEGSGHWLGSNWMYILVAAMIILMVSLFIFFKYYRNNKAIESEDSPEAVPSAEFRVVFNRKKQKYDVCTKHSHP